MKLKSLLSNLRRRQRRARRPFQVEMLEVRVLPAISIENVTFLEGNPPGTTNFSFAVNLSAASGSPITVEYFTADGTATSAFDPTGTDFIAQSGILTFNAGETSRLITVFVNRDIVFEPNEVFTVNLLNPSGDTIADDQADGTILNDDAVPTITIDDLTQSEGDVNSTMDFTVSLSNPSHVDITVNVATADGTANAGSDYTAVPLTTLTFLPGATTATVSVPILGDDVAEADETFFVNLSGETNATIGDAQGIGTILNDEPAFTINNRTKDEGTAGTTIFDFTVTLDFNDPLATYMVQFSTADGSATLLDGDYQTNSGTLTFLPGDTSETINILVNGDTVSEAFETFFVNLTAPTADIGAQPFLNDPQGLGTIQNDDAVISISDGSVTEGNVNQSFVILFVTLAHASTQTVTVSYVTLDNTATLANNDYEFTSGAFTFTPGQVSKTFTIPVNGDGTREPNETFFVNLSAPASSPAGSASFADSQGIGTIINDDGSLNIIETVTPTDNVADGNLNFGGVKIGSETTVSFTLENTGVLPITITSWGLTSPFIITPTNLPNNPSDDLTLGAGESIVMFVTFLPTETKIYNGNLVFLSNDVGGTFVLGLHGHGRLADLTQTSTVNNRYVFTDGDGDVSVLSFRGPGQAFITFADFNGIGSEIDTITFSNTSTRTHYRLASTGESEIATIANTPNSGTGFGNIVLFANVNTGITFTESLANINRFHATGSIANLNIAGSLGLFRAGAINGTNTFGTSVTVLRVDGISDCTPDSPVLCTPDGISTNIASGTINIATNAPTPASVRLISIAGAEFDPFFLQDIPPDFRLIPVDLSINVKGSIGSLQSNSPINGNVITTNNIGNVSVPSITGMISAGFGLNGSRDGVNNDPTEIAASIGKINIRQVNPDFGGLIGTVQASANIGEIASTIGISGEIYAGDSIRGIKSAQDINGSITAIGSINLIRTFSVDRTRDGDLNADVTAGAIRSVILEGLLGVGVTFEIGGVILSPPYSFLRADTDNDGL